MKKNKNGDSANFLKANIFGLLGQWLQGIWSSFSRFVRRSLFPNRGRRGSNAAGSDFAKNSPLVGVSQFRNAESLSVKDLIAKVQWRSSPAQANSSPSVSSIKDKIDWD